MKNIIYSFFISFLLLTRIRIPFQSKIVYDDKLITGSQRFFPVVGLLYGIILFFTIKILSKFNINIELLSLAILSIPYFINKFFHFDGLCDVIDAFFADRDPLSRLDIMKDSRIGSFALGMIIILILLKFILLKLFLLKPILWPFIILIPVYSRYSMVILSFISRYAREKGTAFQIVTNITFEIFLSCTIIFLIINYIFYIIFIPIPVPIFLILISILILIIVTFLFKIYSNRKIGGITGDVLGALNEVIELILIAGLIIYNTSEIF